MDPEAIANTINNIIGAMSCISGPKKDTIVTGNYVIGLGLMRSWEWVLQTD
jgi:hypothetical protein